MKISMPSRILDRETGGNTTYARNIEAGLIKRGHQIERIPSYGNPLSTMIGESIHGLKNRGENQVIHYLADTGALVKGSNPTVVTVHGVASRWVHGTRSWVKEKIWRARVSLAIRTSDSIITVSQSSANDIAEVFGVSVDDINVVPHGIDILKFTTQEVLSPGIAEVIGGQPFVLYLGNIEPRKNLANLIQAFRLSPLASSGVALVIAGKPAWDYSQVMELIDESPNVIHLGFVSDSDRVALMQACALFVFPSLYEGFGFPVVEALAAGAVVASTRNGSLEEVAGPSLLLSGTDPESLSVDIAQGLSDVTAREMCQSGGLEWAQRFSWERSVIEHERLYKELLCG